MSVVTKTRPYEAQRTQFESETTEHVMTVKHDDGLYRHLRFAKPGTSMWSWELITWPGHLAIAGDIGDGWSFSREDDMFEFFGRNGHTNGINPGYWWEKMPSQLRTAAKSFSPEKFRQHAIEFIDEYGLTDAQKADLIESLEVEVFGIEDGAAAVEALEGEWPALDTTVLFRDVWDWTCEDYDWHFILALFAITFGIKKYAAWKADQIPEVTDTLLIDQGWNRPADEPLAVEPELERDCA